MQVLAEPSIASLSGEVSMAPGYTHEPLAGPSLVYPWHQVVAVSDCLWLAMEFQLS